MLSARKSALCQGGEWLCLGATGSESAREDRMTGVQLTLPPPVNSDYRLGVERVRVVAEAPDQTSNRRLELRDEYVWRRGLLGATISLEATA